MIATAAAPPLPARPGGGWLAGAGAVVCNDGPMQPLRPVTWLDELDVVPADKLQELRRAKVCQSARCLTARPDGSVILRPLWALIQWNGMDPGIASVIMMSVMTLICLAILPGTVIIWVPLLCMFTVRRMRGAAILTGGDLIIRTWYGRRRALPRSQIARAGVLQAAQRNRNFGDGKPYPVLLVAGRDGTFLRRLFAVGMSYSDTLTLAAALMVPVATAPDPLRLTEMARRFPGSVPWWLSRVAGTILVLLIFAASVAVTVAIYAAIFA